MLIVGAGMSGLMAGQFFRHLNPKIIEAQDGLPNNHSALLRFRSSAVSELTAIPFREVKVTKAIVTNGKITVRPSIRTSNLYSQKVNGTLTGRSIDELYPVTRYIAPSDFIPNMSRGLNIEYGSDFHWISGQEPIISTIPLPVICDLLGIDCPFVTTRPIWTLNTDLLYDSDIYQTMYYPDPDSDIYRLSVTGGRITAEFINEIEPFRAYTEVTELLRSDFGIGCTISHEYDHRIQENGKLVEWKGPAVKDIIQRLTTEFGIYSLGRWATHRQILADDVVNDIKVIDNMIRSRGYKR